MSQQGVPTRPRGQEDLILLLKEAQNKYGCVPKEAMAKLADSLDISINEVYGVASFYSLLSTKPLGKNIIRICKSLPCYLKHCQIIIESVEKEIGIIPGQTTTDGRFSFQLINCIGACDKAPAMMVNADVHTDLTPKKISQILKTYK